MKDGVDIFGYTPWGIIDIVSSGTIEMNKRYGVIYADRAAGQTGGTDRTGILIEPDLRIVGRGILRHSGHTM